MPSAAFFRSKARNYLRQAGLCADESLAEDLRQLARAYYGEADRLDAASPPFALSAPEVERYASRR